MQAAINFLFLNPPPIFRAFGSPSHAAWDLGLLALSANACTLAVGLWSAGKDHSWLLSLHGLALGAVGAILVYPWTYDQHVSFRPLSLLFVAMAASIGAFALETAKDQRRSIKGRWFLIVSGATSIAFAFSSITLGFLISPRRVGPPQIFLIWLSSYFAFYATFMLWFAFRVHSRGIGQSGQANPFLPAPSPIHTL